MILHNTFNKNKRYQNELCEACLYGLDIPEHDVGWGANCINYKQSYRMIVCDSPFLGPRDIKQINHARVGLDHHLEGLGYFNNQDKPSDRAEMFMSLFNFSIKPYYLNFKGHILLVVDRSGLYTSLGYDPTKWINDTIQTIRTHTDRDIEVRFKNTDHIQSPFPNTRVVPFIGSYFEILKAVVGDIKTEYFWLFSNFVDMESVDLDYIPEQHQTKQLHHLQFLV